MAKFTGFISCRYLYCSATNTHQTFPAEVHTVRLHVEFPTAEEATAYLAARPKYLRFKQWPRQANKLYFDAIFNTNGVTGDKNDAAFKRCRKLLELCEMDEEAIASAYLKNRSTVADLRVFLG